MKLNVDEQNIEKQGAMNVYVREKHFEVVCTQENNFIHYLPSVQIQKVNTRI